MLNIDFVVNFLEKTRHVLLVKKAKDVSFFRPQKKRWFVLKMRKKLRIETENSITFKEGFEEYIDNCKARNLRDATIKHYKEG